MRQSTLHGLIARDLRAAADRTRALAGDLGEAQLSWTPPDGSWGVGHVFEHLVVTNATYDAPLEALLARTDLPPARADTMVRPALWGRFLLTSMRSPRRMPSPKAFRIGPVPRPDVVGAFLESLGRLEGYLARAAPWDWSRMRLASPAAWFVRYTIGDAFAICAAHALRHLDQVERIRARPDFPR
jgi:hypothetical protein